MLMDAERSLLLIVDVQEKLVPAIHGHEDVLAACHWLLGVAAELEVPVLASEQYPRGLGHTLPELAERLPAGAVHEKLEFSCAAAESCRRAFAAADRPQVVIAGIEAHVCVLQTALGLLADDREVFVVAEAVGSRRPADRELALERMRQAGVAVVSREMVAFEWLHRAGTDAFRAVSRNFLR